jgi:hypothetical protein
MKRLFFATFIPFVVGLSAQVLTIQDGTPARLRLNRTVSSATAHEGDVVDFEVTEPVVVQGLVSSRKVVWRSVTLAKWRRSDGSDVPGSWKSL